MPDGTAMIAGKRISARQLPGLVETHTGTFPNVPIGTALATAMLAYNTHNRPIRERRVAAFMSILERGRWINTGEPIIFSRTAINEGQHRLEAIRRSGIEAPLDIRFGIDERAFFMTGTGASRTPGDTLHILGFPSGTAIAAAARLLWSYSERAFGGASWRLGADEIAECVQRWPQLIDAYRLATNFSEAKTARASATVAVFLFMQAKNLAIVEEFMSATLTGVVPHRHDPARLLREKLAKDYSLRLGTRESAVRRLALYLIAWQGWLAGDRSGELEWINGDPFPYLPDVTV